MTNEQLLDIMAMYATVESKLSKADPCSCFRVHSGMYGAKDSKGDLWKVYYIPELRVWVGVDWHSYYGNYTDHYPTKKDVLYQLGFDV